MKSAVRLMQASLVAAGLMFLSPRLLSQSEVPPDDVTRECLRFTEVYTAVEQNYVERTDPDRTIFDGAIRGMLSTLDPFSAFFDRGQFELLQQQARGQTRGFGSILYVQPGKVLVLQTREGSPSWRAGLGPGDEIVEVNGTRINRLDFRSLLELLQRARSQPVRLGVIRPGKVVAQDFELNPAEMPLRTVDRAFLLSPRIAYIHVSSFEQKTPKELVEAVVQLGGSQLRGLLLDLRDNHGGMLDAALGVASLFLKPDQPVLTVRGRAVPEKSFGTLPSNSHIDLPTVVLVNGNTASAAEVVTAALQEHDRAVIAGEPTFGKGVVETVIPLSEQTGLALTTAQYFTASGRSIQRPLRGTAFAPVKNHSNSTPRKSATFRTDNGRPLSTGGGITPDVAIPARKLDPWVTFLNQRGTFIDFAQDYLTVHGKVDPSFEPDSKVLESFKQFLIRSRIRVPDEYWAQDQPYLKLRIKTEIMSLVFGLDRGDEIEVKADPQVQKAASLFPRIPVLLKPHAAKPGAARAKPVPR